MYTPWLGNLQLHCISKNTKLIARRNSWNHIHFHFFKSVIVNLCYSMGVFAWAWYFSCERNTQAAVHYSSVQHDRVSHLTTISVKGWHMLGGGSWVEPIDEMKQVDFSLGLKWNEKQMSWRVTESVCVLSARPMWVMALIWPPAPWLFIILRWQGGAGKRRGLGAPSWSITPEVSFPSYLTVTWITAALVYRRQPIWMSSRRRKRFLCSLYQSRWVIGRMECTTSFSSTCTHTPKKSANMHTLVRYKKHTSKHMLFFSCVK